MYRFWDGFDGSHFERFSQFADSPARWGAMILVGLFLIALLVVGILLLVKLSKRSSNQYPIVPPEAPRRLMPDNSQSMGILNDRLARGEINEEEYDKIKTKLGG